MPRRHRIFSNEIPYVAYAIVDRLGSKPDDQIKYGEGQALFRVLWRLKEHRPGHPSYPEIEPGVVSNLIQDIRLIFGDIEDRQAEDCNNLISETD